MRNLTGSRYPISSFHILYLTTLAPIVCNVEIFTSLGMGPNAKQREKHQERKVLLFPEFVGGL